MSYDEGMDNLRRRIELRRMLLKLGEQDPSYLSPAMVLAANEYLWRNAGNDQDLNAGFAAFLRER
jgi:hypothetical protein